MVEIENLENLIESGKDSALLRFTLGSAFLKHNKFREAIEHLGKAVEMQPGYSAAWKIYGKALEKSGSKDEAMDAYRKGIEVATVNGDIQAVKEMDVFLTRLKNNPD
jgi:Tfp pilus assembly protein PilF